MLKFDAKILADSINPSENRLTTMELTYPRCIHSEFMTHRQFSRNSASSRAIPIEKMLKDIQQNPFVPVTWGLNQKGMQAGGEHEDRVLCEVSWLRARDEAVACAKQLNNLGLHKQIVNRIVEPWMWITVIATGVDHAWENFFKLRCHQDAEPHIQKIAYMARDEFDTNEPRQLKWGDLHLPLFGFEGDEEITIQTQQAAISTARCARVSYRTHDGRRDVSADLSLHDRLASNGHWSPFEHVAKAVDSGQEKTNLILEGKPVVVGHAPFQGGNFGEGWEQYRKTFQAEYCRKAPR